MTKEYIIKEMTGSAFKSKSENPNAPQFTGTVKVRGEELWVSVWQKKTQHDDDYFSMKFEEKRAKPKEEKKEKKRKYVDENEIEEDTIPF